MKESLRATPMGNLTSAVAISIIVSTYHINLERDELTALLKSLLIHADAESRCCPDYEDLVEVIGDTK